MILYLRSALFLVWFAIVSIVMNVGSLPLLLLPPRFTLASAKIWARLVLFGLRWAAGLKVEVRGAIPGARVLVAIKHFSMWETIALLAVLSRPAIVLKQSLLKIPFYGWYSRKMRMIAIDRSTGAKAIRRMHSGAIRALSDGRPIVVFPEGTRRKPHAPPDYKPGIAALYGQLRIPCVPATHNSGLFWAGSFIRKPGTIVLQFLEPIPPALPRGEFMSLLQWRIEEATNELLAQGEEQIARAGSLASTPFRA
jgi:1-acyl-sn-glycerol-3-phosphate acyltransferase